MATLPPFIFFFHARESFRARSAQDHSGSALDLMGLRQVSCLPGGGPLHLYNMSGARSLRVQMATGLSSVQFFQIFNRSDLMTRKERSSAVMKLALANLQNF